jgi:hypothetical protein
VTLTSPPPPLTPSPSTSKQTAWSVDFHAPSCKECENQPTFVLRAVMRVFRCELSFHFFFFEKKSALIHLPTQNTKIWKPGCWRRQLGVVTLPHFHGGGGGGGGWGTWRSASLCRLVVPYASFLFSLGTLLSFCKENLLLQAQKAKSKKQKAKSKKAKKQKAKYNAQR